MIKIKLPNYLYIKALLLALGISTILLSIIYSGPVIRPVLEPIGIGLLAAAAVNLLDRSEFTTVPHNNRTRSEPVCPITRSHSRPDGP